MSLLLYGIVETDGEGPFGTGLDGGPLRGVVEESLLAVVSEHAGAAPEPSAATLTAYERIVHSADGPRRDSAGAVRERAR